MTPGAELARRVEAGGLREVRPTWSAREWAMVSTVASRASMAVATWSSRVVLCGLERAGRQPEPPRCSRRPLLWGLVLERWQSVSWAVVALRDCVDHDAWAQVSQLVGHTGVMITSQADAAPDADRRVAAAACQAATTSALAMGPRARQRAVLVDRGNHAEQGHRAKVLFATVDHEGLIEAGRTSGWTVSGYVGAVTALTASLLLAGGGKGDDLALLEDLVVLTREAAATGLGMLTARSTPEASRWAAFADQVLQAWTLVDALRSSQLPVDRRLDVAALVPKACIALGWATGWGVKPQ
jgi:hypothetical protein